MATQLPSGIDNPDASPSTDVDRFGIIGRARRTFRVGRDEIHTICVETSIWRGLRTHSIDAAGNSTPTRRGPYRIQLGTTEQHQIEVRVDKIGRVNAFVDGERVEYDLFPRVRVVIIALVAALVAAFVVVVSFISWILVSKYFDV